MNGTWRRMKKQLLADRRKLSILLTLACFGLLLWARVLLQSSPQPVEARVMSPAMRQFDGFTPQGAWVEEPIEQPKAYRVQLHDQVVRDLFRFDPHFYTRLEKVSQDLEPVAKSPLDPVDEEKAREEAESAVRVAARRLVLQSTMLGRNPRAMINDRHVTPGESIQGFELVEVKARQVILRKDGFELILGM